MTQSESHEQRGISVGNQRGRIKTVEGLSEGSVGQELDL